MSKKLILFLMVLLLGNLSLLRAETDEVVIGDPAGTTTSVYVPTYSFYNYALTQQIYTAEEIGGACTITGISFWLNSTTAMSRDIQIYIKNTDKNEFASVSDLITMAETDLVYEGTVSTTYGTPQKYTFEFTTPFISNGENVVVCVNDNTGSWKSGFAGLVFGESSDPKRAVSHYNDTAPYDPTNLDNKSKGSMYLSVRNVVAFDVLLSSDPEIAIEPATIDLGYRPIGAWTEPVVVTVSNTGGPADVTLAVDNESIVVPEFEPMVLGRNESYTFEMSAAGEAGNVNAQLTVNYSAVGKDVEVAPITAVVYAPAEGDVVETAIELGADPSNMVVSTGTEMKPNYNLAGMSAKQNDIVYHFNITHDIMFETTVFNGTANVDDATIALYINDGVNPVQPMADNAMASTNDGSMTTKLLVGDYYIVIASDVMSEVNFVISELPAPVTLTYVSPADKLKNVELPVVLEWIADENATEYQLRFGSTYPPQVIVDWTTDMVESYTISENVYPNTNYFWQVSIRNSNGTIDGPVYGFTTVFDKPFNFSVTDTELFEGENAELKWKGGETGGFVGEYTVCEGDATETNIPVYGLYLDDYARSEFIIPAEMIEEIEGATINGLRFYIQTPATVAWTAILNVYMTDVDNTTMTAYTGSENATIVYTGLLDGTATEMNISFDQPFVYEGGNLLIGTEVVETGNYKTCTFVGTTGENGCSAYGSNGNSLAAASFNAKNFLPKTTFVCGDSKMNNRSFLGFNVYSNGVKVNNELITEKEYTLSGLTYNMANGYDLAVTCVYGEGESYPCDAINVKVSGAGSVSGTVYEIDEVTPVVGATITLNGTDEFGDPQVYELTTDANGFYTGDVYAGNYVATASMTDYDPVSSDEFVVVYGQETANIDFVIRETYYAVASVRADELDETLAKIAWTMNGVLPGGGGTGDEFEFGFEADLEGWTNIDADGDGHVWYHNSQCQTSHGVLSMDSHTGVGHVVGESYCNGSHQALTPDNYLVSPQKYNIGGSSVLSFWAVAQDASYPLEHFGVAISTTGNTSASDFTTIQEWTLTAKSTGEKKARGLNASGSWYEFTCDLSAYAGQQVWIAIRHFNVSDQFIICIDDMTLTNGAKGNRSRQYFSVYRQNLINENAEALEPELIIAQIVDTAALDVNWGLMTPGAYKYGVTATYGGNHNPSREMNELTVFDGTDGNGFVPLYGLYADAYLRAQFIMPASELAEMANGEIESMKFYLRVKTGSLLTSTWRVYVKEVDFTEFDAYVDPETATTVYTGVLNTTQDEMVITFDAPYVYNGGNLLVGIDNITKGNYASTSFYGVDGNGNCTAQGYSYSSLDLCPFNFRSGFLPKTTFTYDKTASPETAPTWSNFLYKDMATTVALQVVANSNDTVTGAIATLTNVNEPSFVYEVEFDATGVAEIADFHKGQYLVTVELEGYESNVVDAEYNIWEPTTINVNLTEALYAVEDLVVSGTGYARWTNVIPEATDVAQYYTVKCNGVFQGTTENNYMMVDVTNLVVGEEYTVEVAVVYSTGMSAYTPATFTYIGCENVEQGVESLDALVDCHNLTLTWNGGTPTPPVPPTPGGDTYDFEDGTLQGWTNIDADGDGNVWQNGVVASLPGHNGSTGLVFSQSYINYVGALTPDNYLVSPTKISVQAGSAISFWAAAQDAAWAAEHYGVAISTGSNTNANDFTTIWEETMTAKRAQTEAYANSEVRGTRDQGAWYQKTIDLSAYAGQEIWVAIRHFNCTDYFYLDIDDITLGSSKSVAKGNVTFDRANAGQQAVVVNGNNTREDGWYYYDDGNNVDAIGTNGGTFYWGVMFPAGQYEGNKVIKVAAWDYMPMTGTLTIYQGGSSAPGTSVGSMNVSFTGSSNFVEFEFAEPVVIDPAQNLWVVFYNASGATFPAAVSNDVTGNPNGRWVSIDGSDWMDLATAGISGATFMVRAYIGAGGGGASSTIKPNAFAIFCDGNVVGSTTGDSFNYELTDNETHLFEVVYVDGNYNMSCVESIEVEAGFVAAPTALEGEYVYTSENDYTVELTWEGDASSYKVYRGFDEDELVCIGTTTSESYIDDRTNTNDTYYYAVTAVSGDCESDYSNVVTVVVTNVEENGVVNAIYPNPTSGDLYIYANGMTRVSVVNALGQTVLDKEVSCNEMSINMAQFEAGIYMVNIITETGSSVNRITVVK
ncbi:MAG: choice-of-anchor J domain-containing protein [Candidatus Limimorpha sp.]